jgi:hypothetical protein
MSHWLTPRARASGVALVGVLALCAALACAACTSTGGPPPKIGQDCGTITRSLTDPDPTGPTHCLLAAYSSCRAATLVYIQMDTDTSDTHTIYVTPQGSSCTVSDADLWYFASGIGKTERQDYRCTGVKQAESSLVFTSTGFRPWPGEVVVTGCGQKGDIHLPALPPPRAPQQIGVSCGLVSARAGQVQGDPTGPETCFWHAYTSCQAATLHYTTSEDNRGYLLSILPHDTICALYLQEVDKSFSDLLDVYTCDKLVQQSNGLAVPTCTDAGQVEIRLIIPAR